MTTDNDPDPLKNLDARIKQARGEAPSDETEEGEAKGKVPSGIGIGFRIGTELVAGLILGVGIGLFLDKWLDSAPWFMVLFFFLGSAAGMLNVYRTVNGLGMASGYRPAEKDAPSGDAPEDGDKDKEINRD